MSQSSALNKYWKAYGGFSALLCSKYLWFSFIYTLLVFPSWLGKEPWWDDVLTIVPGLLGFSLGGFAIWVAIGDDKFRSLIVGSEVPDEASSFMEINATFTHFIVIQIIAIFIALLMKSYSFTYEESIGLVIPPYEWVVTLASCLIQLSKFFYFVGYFFFIYAIASGLATVFALFSVSSWYDEMKSSELQSSDDEQS